LKHQRKKPVEMILISKTFKYCFSQSLLLHAIRKISKVSWPRKACILRKESLEFLLEKKKEKEKNSALIDFSNYTFAAQSTFRMAIFLRICAKNCLF